MMIERKKLLNKSAALMWIGSRLTRQADEEAVLFPSAGPFSGLFRDRG